MVCLILLGTPPVHLSKPYYDEDSESLLINLSCPTAGLLAGDRMVCDVEASEQASMVVTTPGATRSHYMRSGIAQVNQKFKVGDGAFLEFNPGSLILQKSTSLVQCTQIDADKNAEILYVEKILQGLPEGNPFQFSRFANRLKIHKNRRLILLENFDLNPEDNTIDPWRNSFPSPFYGCMYLISPKVSSELPCRDSIHGLMNDRLLVGATSMHRKAGWTIKVLAGFRVSKKQ